MLTGWRKREKTGRKRPTQQVAQWESGTWKQILSLKSQGQSPFYGLHRTFPFFSGHLGSCYLGLGWGAVPSLWE